MQDPNLLSISAQTKHLGDAFRSLNDAYCGLSQTYGLWNPEVDEYLHEELYLDDKAKAFMARCVDALHAMNEELFRLVKDHQTLVSDLERVGRGDSFSV